VLLLALSVTALSLQAAFGEDIATVDLALNCKPAVVGVGTTCTALITETDVDASSFHVKVGANDFEQSGQPSEAVAVERAREFDVITAWPAQYKPYLSAMRAANPRLILNGYVNGTHTWKTTLPEGQYCHDASGARVVTTGLWAGTHLMDPSSSGWRETLLSHAFGSLQQSGYDGVFLDEMGRGALTYTVTGHCIDPRTGREYTIAQWEHDTSELAAFIEQQTGRSIVANGLYRGSHYFGTPSSAVIAQHVHAGLAEGFSRGGAFVDGWPAESLIMKDVQMVADAPAMHVFVKDWRAVDTSIKDQEMRYAFAAFLLGTDGTDVFGWTGSRTHYTSFHPLWNTDLGSPRGAAYSLGGGRYRRDFARGHVVLDTVAHTGYVGSTVVASSGDHTVTWSSTGDGTFASPVCTSDGAPTTTCQVTYTPRPGSAGPHTITATDPPEDGSAAAVGTTTMQVGRRQSTTTVTCGTPLTLPAPSECTVTVSDTSGGAAVAPTGEVAFSAVGEGAFGSRTCTLVPGSASVSRCSVTYTPTAPGDHQVSATFPSDVDHQASSSAAPAVISVEPEIVTDVTPPVVQILSPPDGTAIKKGSTIEVVATATDDVGVTNVEFAADGVVMCRDVETTRMTCAWSVPRKGSTGFIVTVTAWDAAGNTATGQISIRVVTGRA
jgi:hypothetical protein